MLQGSGAVQLVEEKGFSRAVRESHSCSIWTLLQQTDQVKRHIIFWTLYSYRMSLYMWNLQSIPCPSEGNHSIYFKDCQAEEIFLLLRIPEMNYLWAMTLLIWSRMADFFRDRLGLLTPLLGLLSSHSVLWQNTIFGRKLKHCKCVRHHFRGQMSLWKIANLTSFQGHPRSGLVLQFKASGNLRACLSQYYGCRLMHSSTQLLGHRGFKLRSPFLHRKCFCSQCHLPSPSL